MKLKQLVGLIVLCVVSFTVTSQNLSNGSIEQTSKKWKGHTFTSANTLSENIAQSDKFSILNNILENEKVRKVTENGEEVTIFVFLDSAFDNLEPIERKSILAGNSASLRAMLMYYIIPGHFDSYELAKKSGKGIVYLNTIADKRLGFKVVNGRLNLVDTFNNTSEVLHTNYPHKNGIFHIVDGLVFPDNNEKVSEKKNPKKKG